jgi:nicotinic acid mononucleotide adenylyltransferase
MIIYRVENPDTEQGLWYRQDATFNPFIRQLTKAKCRDLPMEFDELYSAEGKAWYSGTDSIAQMQDWLPWQDLVELQHLGYGLYEYDVHEWKHVPGHIIYTREAIIASRQLPMEVLK